MMLFEPFTINNKLKLNNRIAMPPVVTRLATEDGDVTDKLIDRYVLYAKGGSALVLMEAVSVETQKSGQLLRLNDDGFIARLQRARRPRARRDRRQDRPPDPALHEDRPLRLPPEGGGPGATTTSRRLPKMWADAAYRAREAGMDAVELHFAHAYTLASFLSRYNKRKDEYGGKMENRLRLMSEIIVAVREAVGDDFCLGTRINGDEFTLGGNTLTDSRADRAALRRAGPGLHQRLRGGQVRGRRPQGGRVARSLHRLLGHPHHAAPLDAGEGQHLSGRRHQAHPATRPATPSPSWARAASPRPPWPKTSSEGRRRPDRPGPSHPVRPLLAQQVQGRPRAGHPQVHLLQPCREMEGGYEEVTCIQWKRKAPQA